MKFIIVFISLFLTLSAAEALTAEIRCANCGKSISGTYYVSSDNQNYCETCWKNNAICDQCGKFTRSPSRIDGHNFCASCAASFERCGICSKPLIGNFTRYPDLGLAVCPECERNKPHCDRCGIPMKKPVNIGDTELCQRCAGQVETCHSCGTPLLRDFSYFEGDLSLKFCLACTKNYVQCDDCGAPIGPNGTTLDDGRGLCPECRRIAIFDINYINPIRKKVATFISGNMNMPVERDIDFSLQDKDFLKKKARGIHGDLNGLFYQRADNFYIYVLYGLRDKDYISVIAHEYCHAWQAENCPDDMPLEVQEGFAQWVAYKTLIHFGHQQFAELMKFGDNVYAQGLNKMLKIEKARGPQAVFKMIRGQEAWVN